MSEQLKPTEFPEINNLLQEFQVGVKQVLGNNLLGLYLTGSLSYGDFNPKRSDIDLITIVRVEATKENAYKLKVLHQAIEEKYPNWKNRVECSYTPIKLFDSVLPPKEPRPYYGDGKFYFKAPYGNEWLINKHLLFNHGVVLMGPKIKDLIEPVDIDEVKNACIRDLREEWEPKITDPHYLDNPHQQSYVVLNICRILNTIITNVAVSKDVSSKWVKQNYPEWKSLIEEAEAWSYGKEMKRKAETIKFIKFALERTNA